MYFILLGSVKVCDNTPESLNFMKKTLEFNDKNMIFQDIRDPDKKLTRTFIENEDLDCIDDDILREFKDDLLNDKDKNPLFKNINELQYGESFGCILFVSHHKMYIF